MSHQSYFYRKLITVFCIISMLFLTDTHTIQAASNYSFVILSNYSRSMAIGDEYYLLALSSNGSRISFTSSSSSIASVDTYGKITAKKAGKATITCKAKGGYAKCMITVKKTVVTLSSNVLSLENGSNAQLFATVSTGHAVRWKSSKSSIASIDSKGLIIAKKPGSTTITATSDKTSVTCKVTVKRPTVTISHTSATLYRDQTLKLNVKSSSKSRPVFKSNKKSVAVINSDGVITAIKHGTAVITIKVDNVSKTCRITVKKPDITFSPDKKTLSPGQTYHPVITVSSGHRPQYSSSNCNIASVDANGTITARQPGKVYIYAREDGAKASLIVTVK